MISKPLFKQSSKANATIWSFVTVLTCAMMAILICVLGNFNFGSIRDNMSSMFIEDSIESAIKKQTLTYYNMTESALSGFDKNTASLYYLFNTTMAATDDGESTDPKATLSASYEYLIQNGSTHEEAVQAIVNSQGSDEAKQVAEIFLNYYAAQGANYDMTNIQTYVLKQFQENIYNELLETDGEESAEIASQFITVAITAYIEASAENENLDATEFATTYIPGVLSGVFAEQIITYQGREIAVVDYFDEEEIYNISYSAIMSYRAEMQIKYNQLVSEGYDGEELEAALAAYQEEYIAEHSASLLDNWPQDIADALTELGELDIYALVIGEIFFRIAGILLPIIFVIMCSNNLISSQVDRGSMAYVLSTPTKRNTVTMTQIAYLLASIFAMCCLITITGVVCLAIVGTAEFTITYTDLLLLNLGLFVTLFAFAGICFMTSCYFNRSTQAMSVGGGLSMFFLVATILGLFGSSIMPSMMRIDAMNYFNYVSIITLFDASSILSGSLAFLWKLAILAGIGIVTFTLGVVKFNKKDLPL